MAIIGEMKKLTVGNKTYTLPSGGGGTLTDTYDSSTKTLTLGLSSGSLTDTYDSTTKTLTLSM